MMKICDNVVTTSPKRGIILYEYMKLNIQSMNLIWLHELQKARAAFKLNTARSSKYKMSLTSLFRYCCTCTSPLIWHLVWLGIQQTWCSGVPSASSNIGAKTKKDMTKKLHICLFQRVGYLCWFGYLNWLESTIVFIQSHFKSTEKNLTLSAPPSPAEIYLLQTHTSLNFNLWIFSGTTHCQFFIKKHYYILCNTFIFNKILIVLDNINYLLIELQQYCHYLNLQIWSSGFSLCSYIHSTHSPLLPCCTILMR